MSDSRKARPDHPIHDLLTDRHSPYCFADTAVATSDLAALFTAASWAASSFNEQPWRYLVATKDDAAAFDKMLGCLAEANQQWARHAPVLALGVSKDTFSRNDKPNRVALHDLGAASASLTIEATARGLAVHQMAGIDQDKARAAYNVPAGFVVQTAIAIGYRADPDDFPDSELADRDRGQRTRKALDAFVFAGDWESPAGL